MAIEAINSTTYKADDIGDVKPKIVIGGKEGTKFVPNVNASMFDDEFYININRKGKIIENEIATLSSGVISQKVKDETDEFYIDDKGRLKWDTVFSKIPATMVLEYDIKCTNGIEYYYQDTLENDWKKYNDDQTLEEYLKNHHRADDIVGSYAVFCSRSHGKYKTGKLCHIPRPYVIDADGKTEWCMLIIDKTLMSIALPVDFMNAAKYPVRLDPTIGFSGVPGSTGDAVSDARYMGTALAVGSFAAASNGTATKMCVYISSVPTAGNTVYAAAYDADTPRDLIQGGSKADTWTDDAYNDIDITDFAIVAGTSYYPALGLDVVSGTIGIGYDSTLGNGCDRETDTGVLPATWNAVQDRTYIFGVYIDYTASSSGIAKQLVHGALADSRGLVHGGLVQ